MPCGYCRKHAFAISKEKMYCSNLECRAFQRKRSTCTSCNRVSAIMHNDKPVCVNRNCSSNRSVIAVCFFCSNLSFLRAPDLMFCTKSDCKHLFQRVEDCSFCGVQSSVVEDRVCKNPRCQQANTPMESCPKCEARTLWRRATGEETCLNDECDYAGDSSSSSRTHHDVPVVESTISSVGDGKEETSSFPVLEPPKRPIRAMSSSGNAPSTGSSHIEKAWESLKNNFILPGQDTSPVYLVVGLPGAGKTTFLTMIGEILRCKNDRYSFPYEGVDARWIGLQEKFSEGDQSPQMKTRVRDLVWDFAQKNHTEYFSRMHWPAPTPPDQGGEIDPSTFFLLTEIVREGKSLGHVITLETAGEEYEEVIRNITSYISGSRPKNPVHRVLLDMLLLAEGVIILLDPEQAQNDEIYDNFFMVLREQIRPRALNVLHRELKKVMPEQESSSAKDSEDDNLRDMLVQMKGEESARERWEAEWERRKVDYRDRLFDIQRRLRNREEHILQGEAGEFLQSLEATLEGIDASLVERARKKVLRADSPDERKKNILRYYQGLIDICLERLDSILRAQPLGDKPAPMASRLASLRLEYGLSSDFKIESEVASARERPVNNFKFLKHVSVVVTKSDRNPIIYPAEHYPRLKLPHGWMHLRMLENYLRLCGGKVRYYNTSATGYTIMSGGIQLPGRPNSHTPINVVEPLFDILGIS
jgi:hypothetical protein